MRYTIALVMPLLAAVPLPAQDAAEAVAAVDAFQEAMARGDSAAVLALLAPDVVVYEMGGVEASREEFRTHHMAADMRFAAMTTRDVVARRAARAGDVAWVLTETVTTRTTDEGESRRRGTETMVLRRAADGWRIVHIHWSSARR